MKNPFGLNVFFLIQRFKGKNVPVANDIEEVLEFPQAEEAVFIGVEVVKHLHGPGLIDFELLLQHVYGVFPRQAARCTILRDVLLKHPLRLRSEINRKVWLTFGGGFHEG